MKLFVAFKDRKLKRFSRLLSDFVDFHSKLVDIKMNIVSHDPLDALVCFFDESSRWEDRGLENMLTSVDARCRQRHDVFFRSLETLQGHIACAGRTRFGWNRTKVGEVVTPEQVFLGNVYGLFTKPVSFWKQRKGEEKGGWGFPGMEYLNAYDVVASQSTGFLMVHLDSMISSLSVIIEELLRMSQENQR